MKKDDEKLLVGLTGLLVAATGTVMLYSFVFDPSDSLMGFISGVVVIMSGIYNSSQLSRSAHWPLNDKEEKEV